MNRGGWQTGVNCPRHKTDILIPPSAISKGVNAAKVTKTEQMKSSLEPSHLEAVMNRNHEAV